ncbi:MAG TPA: hypothetical protein DHW02_10485 [Ktedonobacter sp.]|nr:hypothetical protein [Ktedonobacter sp.]
MSQQEMGFEGSHYEQNPEYALHAQHYSDQYGQSQIAQKLPRKLSSKKMAMRIQLWTAYISLFIAMVLSFLIGGQDWGTLIYSIVPTTGILLLVLYTAIIIVNILVFVLVNFNVKVTRKPRQ